MKKLILLETLADGSIVEYPLQTLQTIIARQGAGYAVIDKESGKPPRDMTLKREGDALAVQVSGETVVQLDAFYEEGASAAYTVDGADTSAEAVLITSSQGQTAENGEIIWQSETAEDDGGVSPWAWGGALAGAGVAALAAGGGGGGSETDTSIPSYTLTVTAAAGPFTSDATVEVYDRNGTLLTTGAIDPETGRVAFTITNAYSGPLMVKVIDANGAAGDYLDEATNTATSLGEPLRAFIMADGSSDIRLTVSPLTELAVRKAGIDEANLSLSADDVAVNDQVAELFGVDDITGDVATVLDDAYDAGDGLSAAETYGNVLAMLSGADGNTGSMDATLDQLESLIHTTGEGDLAFSQEAVDLLSDGIETFENGVNGGEADLNESIIEPPVIPSAENGLNRAEKTGGVAVKLDGAAAGDAVTILWGDQSHTHSVQAGDIDADGLVTITVPESVVDGAGDGDIQVRSQVNGGDASPAVIIHVDANGPAVSNIAITGATGIQSSTLNAGDVVSITVTMDEATTVTGTPQLALNIGGDTVQADYAGGSGTAALAFTYTITNETDADGISIDADSLSLNGGTLTDAAGNAAVITHDAVADNGGYMVDTTAPTVTMKTAIDPVQLEAIGNTTGYDFYPQVGALGGDGAFVVTWYGNDSDGDDSIFVQKFNADGTTTGNDPVQLEATGNTTGDDAMPQVSALGGDGAFVVTWYGVDSGGDRSIFVQKFNTDGTTTGNDPVQLEAIGNTTGYDYYPQVSALGSDGAFVVTWYGNDSYGDLSIFVQKFNADGTTTGNDPVQLEAIGNTTWNDYYPQVSALGSDGAFVVTWYGNDSDGDDSIFVQKFKADGTTTGNDPVQLEAIGNTTGHDRHPQVSAVGSDGDFVVTWYGYDSDGDLSIFVQKFNADGTTTGNDTVQLEAIGNVDGTDVSVQVSAVGSNGDFVVTWRGDDSDGDRSIFVQKFNADGTTTGNDPVQLEAIGNTTGGDGYPQVSAVGGDGAFVVTWYGTDSDGDYSIFVQKFNADGTTTGNDPVQLEAIGNTTGDDGYPQVSAVGGDGAFVVTWRGDDSDGDRSIFVQKFSADGTITESTIGLSNDTGTSSDDFITNTAAQTVTATLSAELQADESLYGSVDGGGTWIDITAKVSGTALSWDGVTLSGSGTIQFKVVDAAGNQGTVDSRAYVLDTTDPTITSGATATALDENSGAGQVVYTVTSDAGDGVIYSLKAVDDYARLSIDGTTGQVTLTGDPDYETQSSYSFTVVATDAAGNATEQAVTLNVNDVDDTPPVILDVSIPNRAMNVGDTVTATITVQDDGGDIYTNLSGTIGGFSPGNLTRIDSTTYTAQFTVTQGGSDVAAGSDIPVNLTIDDTSGNTSIVYTTAVSQAGDSIDANGPTISSIAITGATGIQNSTLNAGDVVSITVTMDKATTVTGTPQLALDIGGATVQANYAGGSGTTALFFTYTITNETDADGISIDTDSLSLNGGTLTDAAGNAAMITHDAVADNAGYMVDTAAPTLSTATPADDATYVALDSSITLTFDEDIALGSSGTITVTDGGDTHTIDVADHSGRLSISGNTLTINPTSDLANNGSTYHVEIDSGAITDTAGNAYAGIDDETTLNFDTVPGVDTSIVVFDLTTGMSSSHSGRTFQADVAYDIYIVVDADSAALSSLDAAEQWSGADALDSDSTIILCGNGDAAGVLGFCGEAVDDYSMTASYIVWMTPSTTNAGAAGLFSTGSFVRCTIGSTSITRLWTGNWAANPDAGQGLPAIYTAQMPVGIMTTQVFT